MFFHKSGPFARAFALTAAAMIVGTTGTSVNAERQKAQDSYCNEGQDCTAQYAGIVQKERDGVNYFYGSSDKTFGYISYQVLRIDYTDHTPYAAPQEIIQPNEFIQYVPYGHSPRPWHHKLKPGHKSDWSWFNPGPFSMPQFHHGDKLQHPAAP